MKIDLKHSERVLKELAQKWHLKRDLKNQLRVKMFMDSSRLVELAAGACDDIKAGDIKLLKVDEVSSIADWILITEGLSDVQVRAIINNVEKTLKEEADVLPLRKEGINEAKWALLDYGDLIINVLQPNERKFYDLESFWSNGILHDFTNNKLIAIKDE